MSYLRFFIYDTAACFLQLFVLLTIWYYLWCYWLIIKSCHMIRIFVMIYSNMSGISYVMITQYYYTRYKQ
jgi:hypothetical protein